MADPTGSGSNGGTTTVVSNPPNPPTTNTVPNTTTDTTTVQFQNAATNSEVNQRLSVNLPGGSLSFADQAEFAAWQNDPQAFAVSNIGGINTVQPLSNGQDISTTATVTAATTGSGVSALVDTLGPGTAKLSVDSTVLQGYVGSTLSNGATTRGTNVTTLNADQADAYYNGTGTLTAAQRLEVDQQTAADAAKLYPGSNNEALRQIDVGAGRIAENEVGIANAEQIVARNNAELADPFISDARRAELLANNEAQQEYIQVATENIAIQENVIEQNANVYAAGGGNPDSGQAPAEVAALEDPAIAQTPVDPTILEGFGVQAPVDPTTLEGYGIQATVDPITIEGFGLPVDPAEDPFETARLEAEVAAAEEGPTETALEVDPLTDEELAVQEAYQQDQRDQLVESYGPDAVGDPDLIAAEDAALFDNLAQAPTGQDPGPGYISDSEQIAAANIDAGGATDSSLGAAGETLFASRTANAKNLAKQQATIQARYKQPGNQDWRVRLSLGPGAQYLYNATPAGVLKPLAANGGTDGVIFPYTPNITTTYSANYEQYDLVHSNYRGIFYKNSRVGDIQLRGTFTAQDTTEANYLLAVIHFFRSVTKMFYGQDEQRGTPPPICLLNGYGGYQFSDHPVVVSSFNYSLPNDVDYIRTTNPNNFGLNLNNRYNPSGVSLPAGGALAGLNRLLNAIPGGLNKGALPQVPAPNTVAGSVTNNVPASYVPTKMEIDVTLIPVQTRSQVSQQFSLKGFANGDLLKGGFW